MIEWHTFVIINGMDYGFEKLPFHLSYHYDESRFPNRNIAISCWSPENITIEIYINGSLYYTENNQFIDYTKY